ncbi:MAG: hypothetical protein IPK50_06895 [Fibrobacterota bacterium]|nr:hypothetical protein [Fibrobacterota bacterium]QQS06620.1 MAG: hypothetical protein IPK50_06895 [Fibrobacterota bacterium]
MSTTLALLTMTLLSGVSVGATTDTLPKADSLKRDSARTLREVPVNIGLAPGHNANGADPENVRNRFALNLVMNDAGAIDGFDLALGLARTRQSMRGFQASIGANLVEGDVLGFQASTANLVLGQTKGLQAAAVANLSRGSFHGLQASGVVNLATDTMAGLQWSGVFNQAGTVCGAQLGTINLAGDVRGLQWGTVNVASKVHGAQIGWINVADSVDGAAIGLLSFAKNIEHQADVWVTESGISNVGLLTGTEHFYTILALSATHPDDVRAYGLTWGLGGRIQWDHSWIALDAVATHLLHDIGEWDDHDRDHRDHKDHVEVEANEMASLRASVGWKMFPHLTVYGGLSGNLLVSAQAPDDEKYLSRNEGPEWNPSKETRIWPGVFMGIRI